MSKKSPPIFLNLLQMHFPVMAIVSICHRVSGVLLTLMMPWMIWIWTKVITLNNYAGLHAHLNHFLGKLCMLVVGAALLFHVIAGIRHLLMDLGFGELKESGRRSAWLVWIIFMICVIAIGVHLC